MVMSSRAGESGVRSVGEKLIEDVEPGVLRVGSSSGLSRYLRACLLVFLDDMLENGNCENA